MQITQNTVVMIDYTLTDKAGEVLDTSQGGEPLAYLHGVGQIIPGLEQALNGKQTGDAFKVSIPPAEAYGEHDPELVQAVPRSVFGADSEIELGARVTARAEKEERHFVIVGLTDAEVTLDGNHPLAGVTLNFDVKVVGVRAATAEELAHGHPHGAHGHGH